MNIQKIRAHFPAIAAGRILTNNAATTQTTFELLELYKELAIDYDSVHRGLSKSSQRITELFEGSYDTIADFIGAESRENIVLYRNTTESINSVMYSLLADFRDGDNVVTTLMEHNSNYIPWHSLSKEILPKFGINVECRFAKFDKETGELDLSHFTSLVDKKTKLICCTGASNFLGTKTPLNKIKEIADSSGYEQPSGEKRSYFIVDGCQLVPHSYIDVKEAGMDFLTWSFHKILAPFGIGVLYAKKELLLNLPPFLYGGDMIEEGRVSTEQVRYNKLPWKFTAGTPNIIGTIASAETIKVILDLVLNQEEDKYFMGSPRIKKNTVKRAMGKIEEYELEISKVALEEFGKINNIKLFGPKDAEKKVPLFSFVCRDKSPMEIARILNESGIEARAGCHCASLAHNYYGLNPLGSCRLSYYFYNTLEEVKKSITAVKNICLC